MTSALWIAAGLLLASATLRVLAAGADLWLDEAWSLSLAQRVSSPLDVVTTIRETNNHPLNTLWLSLSGESAPRLWLRAPSLLFGIAAVALGGLLGARRGIGDALLAMSLLGGSYLMIDTASEARGYAPMAGCVLAAWLALESAEPPQRQGRSSATGWILLFNASVLLGFLFQLSFAIAYAALAAGWAVSRLRARPRPRRLLADFLAWHALPLALFAALYGLWARHAVIGGDIIPTERVLTRTAMLTIGLDGGTAIMWLGAGIAGLLFVAGVVVVARKNIERAFIYTLGIVIAPAIALAFMEPSFLAPRYFLASVVFFLVLVSELLAWLFRRGRTGGALAALLLGLFALGNGALTLPLISQERGNYAQALEIMQRETPPGAEIDIGSRFAFRDRMLLSYHARRLEPPPRLRFVTIEDWPARGPGWLTVTVRSPGEQIEPRVTGPRGNLYREVATFEGLRGREPGWSLYRAVRPNRPPRPR